MHFLLIPASAEQWFEDHQQFRRHVQNVYRLVFEEPGTCAVFSLQEPADAPPDGIAPDGLPVPPPEMVRLVAGMFDWDEIYGMFLSGGQLAAHIDQGDAGKERRRHQGFRFDFDFGCGCGRVIRHWVPLTDAKLHGSDYNPRLVGWCQANLGFGQFTVNGVAPPLDYEDEQFDFLYAISIFTHFVEAQQVPWAKELAESSGPVAMRSSRCPARDAPIWFLMKIGSGSTRRARRHKRGAGGHQRHCSVSSRALPT